MRTTRSRRGLGSRPGRALAAVIAAGLAAGPATGDPGIDIDCEAPAVLASGPPDRTIFARGASRGVRAFWCERYDDRGVTRRLGRYLERYPEGGIRTEGHYVDGRLEGPLLIRDRDGRIFARGRLAGGEWAGPMVLHHPNGRPWLEAHFDEGRLDGRLRSYFPDGTLESETRYVAGREQGLARSFYPAGSGGGLRSEVAVRDDRPAGRLRLLDRHGDLVGLRTPDGPAHPPAAPDGRGRLPASDRAGATRDD